MEMSLTSDSDPGAEGFVRGDLGVAEIATVRVRKRLRMSFACRVVVLSERRVPVIRGCRAALAGGCGLLWVDLFCERIPHGLVYGMKSDCSGMVAGVYIRGEISVKEGFEYSPRIRFTAAESTNLGLIKRVAEDANLAQARTTLL